MGTKEDLVYALQHLPEGIGDFLNTEIGSFPELDIPTTVDEAIIVTGQVSALINNQLLRPFSGLTPVDLALRLGQHHPTLINMHLASLQKVQQQYMFFISSPIDGQSYGTGTQAISVEISYGIDVIESVDVSIILPDDSEASVGMTLDEEYGNVYFGDFDFQAPGTYHIYALVEFDGYSGQQHISIEVTS